MKRAGAISLCIACVGFALLVSAAAANRSWFDRHFLPSFWTPHEETVERGMIVRAAAAIAGLLVICFSRRIGRFFSREPWLVLTIPLAAFLAVITTEAVLRGRAVRATEPRTHIDARLGWLIDPDRTGTITHLNLRTTYVFDRNGYRVASPSVQTNFDAPTIIFTGESIMIGHHLAWTDTIPAQTSSILGIQCANIAVSGFATDQSYLRLETELPRFRHPIAVVSLFAPAIFDRNLDEDRPHLAPGLVWRPPVRRWRITSLVAHVIGYRSDDTIERGVAATRDVLVATVRLARSRGAVPLIVVPQFQPEEAGERELRRRILDEMQLSYIYVPLDPDDRVENDGHPDADGAREIAEAIAGELRPAVTDGRRRIGNR